MHKRRPIVLSMAFAALLLVLAASAFTVWRSAKNTQDRITALHTAEMRADDVLDSIRDNVYLQGILTRDYLLDPDPAQKRRYRTQFESIRVKMEENFQTLERSGEGGAQVAAMSQLRKEFDAYSDFTETALRLSHEEKRARGSEILSNRVHRREEILAVAGQVDQLMTAGFERQGQAVARAGEEFRSSFAWTTGLTLLLGFGIAGVTLARMTDLEDQSQSAESELRNLTAQLRTAQEQERKYLSRELHDQVGQLLTGLRMELGSVGRAGADGHPEIGARVARAKSTVEQILRSVRDIAMLLRPPMLDDLGLTPALAWLIRDLSRSSGIEIRAEIDPSADELPDAYRTCLYRVVQEALTNASRHSGAHNIQVILKNAGSTVSAAITDDGGGFGPGLDDQKSLGLLGMEERARELGGTTRVVSFPGRGTRVEIELPHPGGANVREVIDAANSDRGRSRNRSDGFEASA